MALVSQALSVISIHALRGEGDTSVATYVDFGMISIHALRGEGDDGENYDLCLVWHFYPRPPWGGRLPQLYYALRPIPYFYPRPPWGGRPLVSVFCLADDGTISIHALRGEGDTVSREAAQRMQGFLSTPSVGRATSAGAGAVNRVIISIHALRGEGDLVLTGSLHRQRISIHALRGEGD